MEPTEPVALAPGVELPAELAARVKAELEPGERLIWADRAIVQPRRPGLGSLIALLFSLALLVLGFRKARIGVDFGDGRVQNADQLLGALVLVGIGALVLALLVIIRLSRRTEVAQDAQRLYALTDRRAIVWRPARRGKGVEVHIFERGRIARIHRVEMPDGRGDVIFSEAGTATVTSLEFLPDPVGFFTVPEVRRVEALARSVLMSPAEPPGPPSV